MARPAHGLLSRLRDGEPWRSVTKMITDHAPEQADARLAHALMVEMLGNALKFTRIRPEARIEFSRSVVGDSEHLHVRDKGAGFDQANAEPPLFSASAHAQGRRVRRHGHWSCHWHTRCAPSRRRAARAFYVTARLVAGPANSQHRNADHPRHALLPCWSDAQPGSAGSLRCGARHCCPYRHHPRTYILLRHFEAEP